MLFLLQGVFFTVLLAAACLWDIRKRIIPDTLCLCIALTGFLAFEPEKLFGIFIIVAFLLTALIWGGIGGGDIKLMAATGLVLGFHKGIAAMIIGLTALLICHAVYAVIQKLRGRVVPKAYPLAPFLTLGCLTAYFIIK